MLTPPHCCIQVALSINRATSCFDTSHSRSGTAESGVSSCIFWRTASTNGVRLGTDSHNEPRGFVNWRKIASLRVEES
jgi:hypothetical protein